MAVLLYGLDLGAVGTRRRRDPPRHVGNVPLQISGERARQDVGVRVGQEVDRRWGEQQAGRLDGGRPSRPGARPVTAHHEHARSLGRGEGVMSHGWEVVELQALTWRSCPPSTSGNISPVGKPQ